MHKLPLALGASAILVMVPSMASAHKAVCTPDGYKSVDQYVLLGVDANGKATWADGYLDRTVYPVCPTTPTPAPVPPVAEEVPTTPAAPVTPATPVVPLTCAELMARYPKAGKVRQRGWGCLIEPTPINLPGPDKPKRKITTRYYPCVVGGRPKKVVTVTLPSGKVGTVTTYGKICKMPAVTA